MNILMVGAGAIGGYFGGRLVEKGEDVTFLVREKRKQQLLTSGLTVKSTHGDFTVTPELLVTGEQSKPFDVIIISTKSYQLHGAISDIRPYVSDQTMILPLLNGIAHLDELIQAFGEHSVIGGLCFIETTLDSDGTVLQTSPIHDLIFGERDGSRSDRILQLETAFSGTKATFKLSENINQDMWHKYSFITAMSGVTTLLNSPVGPIRELESGYKTIEFLLKEISQVMKSIDAPIIDSLPEIQLKKMMEMGYSMKSSMQRDMEKSFSTEVDHLQGYLIDKAKEHNLEVPVLEAVYANVKLYEKSL